MEQEKGGSILAMLDHELARHRQRLTELLSFAHQNVPHYKDTISSNTESLVSDVQSWLRVPLLNKQQIQANWASFLSDPNTESNPNIRIRYTSGSSGKPLKIFRPKSELRAQTKRLWASRALWQPNIMRWKLLNIYRTLESPHQKAMSLEKLGSNAEYLDLSPSALAGYIDEIEAFEPDWMYGSPLVIYRLAWHYRAKRLTTPPIKLIEVTGEPLHPHHRNLIESVFGCPVVNQYGCQEFWVLSYECPERSMHAWVEDLLVEVINDGQPALPGETGELVVTSLTNRVMPLIRYRLGDFVQLYPSDCPCGDLRPILVPTEGRSSCLIVTPETIITSGRLDRVFIQFCIRHELALLEYQIIQHDYDQMEIRLVPGERFNMQVAVEELTEGVRCILPRVNCRFTTCSTILAMPSGKTPTYISYADQMETEEDL